MAGTCWMLGRFVGSATRMILSRSFSSGLRPSGSGVMSTFMIRAIIVCTPFLPFASSGSPNGKVPVHRELRQVRAVHNTENCCLHPSKESIAGDACNQKCNTLLWGGASVLDGALSL